MSIFKKSIIDSAHIIKNDETLNWHINNQDDNNRYVVVKSSAMSTKEIKWLARINKLITIGYKPIGGVGSDQAYLYQALYREK